MRSLPIDSSTFRFVRHYAEMVAMLLRRDEYSCATHHGHAQPALAA
jgi:hypothetical protein